MSGAVVAVLFALAGASGAFSSPAAVSDPDTLTVHEWGTFTSVAGADGQAVEWYPLSGPSDLPCFVRMLNPRSIKALPGYYVKGLRSTVRMETPVIYFYAQTEQTARVRVGFPQGLITEWYPQAIVPDPKPVAAIRDAHGSIEWKNVRITPRATPDFPAEKASSHYYAARETDASPVQVGGQHEKFLFYRGLASFPVPVSVTMSGEGAVTIEAAGQGLPHAILFENDGEGVGYRVLGSLRGRATAKLPGATGTIPALHDELRRLLIAEGLYPREADAMIETWRDSWFEEGTRLFYILPQAVVDAVLPLQIDPAPARVARVFVGRVEIITPARKDEVERAVRRNDRAALASHGRFLDPIVEMIAPRFSSASDAARLESVLASVPWPSAAVCR
jgi:hypothetical protein